MLILNFLTTLNVALDFVTKHQIASSYAIITDSQPVLRALSNEEKRCSSHPFVADIGQKVVYLKVDSHRIFFLWSKGNSGISFNERVDKFAEFAVKSKKKLFRIAHTDIFPL